MSGVNEEINGVMKMQEIELRLVWLKICLDRATRRYAGRRVSAISENWWQAVGSEEDRTRDYTGNAQYRNIMKT